MWCSFSTFHLGTSRCSFSNSPPFKGGTPPRQGTHFLSASACDIRASHSVHLAQFVWTWTVSNSYRQHFWLRAASARPEVAFKPEKIKIKNDRRKQAPPQDHMAVSDWVGVEELQLLLRESHSGISLHEIGAAEGDRHRDQSNG